MSKRILKQLIRAKVITKAAPTAAVTADTFLVPETAKRRNRVICWPKWANAKGISGTHAYLWCHETSEQADIVEIVHDVFSRARQPTHAAVMDLKASFYQLGLSPTASSSFVFETRTGKYKFVRLPMGFDQAAEMLQLVTQELASSIVSEANTTATTYYVHVDNALIVGSFAEISSVIDVCGKVADRMSLTFSERSHVAAEEVVFLGIIFNLPGRWVALTDQKIAKLERLAQFVDSKCDESQDTKILFSIFGGQEPLLKIIAVAMYCSRIMYNAAAFSNGSMAKRFDMLQLVSSVARASMSQETYPLHRVAATKLSAWLRAIPHVSRVLVYNSPRYKIVTDASTKGGCFIVTDGATQVKSKHAWRWNSEKQPKDMGVWELAVIAIALANINVDANDSVQVYTDSTIAIGSIQKGYSHSARVNEQVSKIMGRAVLQMNYVRSSENEADEYTRDFDHLAWGGNWHFLSPDSSTDLQTGPSSGPQLV